MTEQAVLNELFSEVALKHPLWNHEFLIRCREGNLREEEVRVLAGQMYKFCREFNRILASAFLHCPDEDARMVIAGSLFDEMGRGDPSQTHPELFRRFTRAIGITDEELEAMPDTFETQEMIDTYMRLPEEHGYLAGLGAISYGSEGIVSTLYAHLIGCTPQGASLSKDSLAFFELYSKLDCDHARALGEVVARKIAGTTSTAQVMLAITDALDARQRFYDGIQRSALQSRKAQTASPDTPPDTQPDTQPAPSLA